jgi:predicted RecB family nuclease
MPRPITASMLYNLVQCPHRVARDLFDHPDERDPVSPFVELLWEKGQAFEQEVIDGLKLPFTDLSEYAGAERERETMAAMRRGDGLIYAGRIRADDLLGVPDLLRRQGDGYVAGDIKSGAGVEGASDDIDGKPKKHYAVQLALYTDRLERLGRGAGRIPFVWDVHGEEIVYDLDEPRGVRKPVSLWEIYQSCLSDARRIVTQTEETTPALGAMCKLCHWRTTCVKRMVASDDLTLIPELGRAVRDSIKPHVAGIRDLAIVDLKALAGDRGSAFKGVGIERLAKFQARARLQVQRNAKPYLKGPLDLPRSHLELFFDIETDPMRDICYLHGFVERRGGDNSTERYVAFFAEGPTKEAEERAFSAAWEYVQASRPCAVYYYSPYERTFWRKLQRSYPHVASESDVEEMFNPSVSVDLYHHVVRPKTEWPTRDFSIKTLAAHLGFKWRDPDPSGASSIEWYHRWVEKGDSAIRKRILEYNEDDCVAMRVLLDAVRGLAIRSG